MSNQRTIEALQTADALKSLQFYTLNIGRTLNPNKGPEIGCRIWTLHMNDAEHTKLVEELNAAISTVTSRWADERRLKALELLNKG